MGQLVSTYKRACELLAVKVEAATNEALESGRDPSGTPWAPHTPATVRRWGRHQLLKYTGVMHAAHTVEAIDTGVRVTFPSPAGYLNDGTKHMVARRFELYEREAETLVQEAFEEAWSEEDPVLATMRGRNI